MYPNFSLAPTACFASKVHSLSFSRRRASAAACSQQQASTKILKSESSAKVLFARHPSRASKQQDAAASADFRLEASFGATTPVFSQPMQIPAPLISATLPELSAEEATVVAACVPEDIRSLADDDSRFANLLGLCVHYKLEQGYNSVACPPASPHALAPAALAAAAGQAGFANGHMDEHTWGCGSRMGSSGAGAAEVRHVRTWREFASATPLAAVLFHGFAASTFSFRKIQRSLAHLLGAAIAFDRPAFGLTQRPTDAAVACRVYTCHFANELVAPLLASAGLTAPRVLIGHSAGAFSALNAYFQNPEAVRAIVLISPCLHEPPTAHHPSPRAPSSRTLATVQESLAHMRDDAVLHLVRLLPMLARHGIHSAWFDPSQASEEDVGGYVKALQVRGWDVALLQWILATAHHGHFDRAAFGVQQLQPHAPDHNTVFAYLAQVKVPVLVIGGRNDSIVPLKDLQRIHAALPNTSPAHLHIIDHCGHLAAEEQPQQVMNAIAAFLATDNLVHPSLPRPVNHTSAA